MKFKIKNTQRTPDAAELASWTDEALEAEYQKHLSAWMLRSNAGQRQTWKAFNEMDAYFLEMQRRKYGPGAVVEAKEELANFRNTGVLPIRETEKWTN